MVALIQQYYVIMASNSSLSQSSCVGNYEAIIPCNIGGHIMFCFLSYRGGFLCCQTIYLSALLALVSPHNALTLKLFILQDRYADSKAVPPIDDQQDYELTDSQESDGKTLLKFKRKFDTCDSRDRKLEVSIFACRFFLTVIPFS